MLNESDTLTSARDFGRARSGPALAAYLNWVRSEVQSYSIDRVVFVEPACGWLQAFVQAFPDRGELWLKGSEEQFKLAEIQHNLIEESLASISIGFNGLNARQIFSHYGVPAPADHVLADLQLTEDLRFGFGQEELTHRFVRAFKWDFYRAANRLRSGLYKRLVGSGLRPGMQVAVVDMGWTSGLVDSCERVIRSMLDVNVHGFSFLLTEADQLIAREARFFFKSFAGHLGVEAAQAAAMEKRLDLLSVAMLPPDWRSGSPVSPHAGPLAAGIEDYARLVAEQGRLSGSAGPLLEAFGREDNDLLKPLMNLDRA
ncbi:MAG: hypothetical protein AB1592_17925 [Pseudomonadota bacterium]